MEGEITEAEPVLLVRAVSGRHVLQRWVIDRRIDLKTMADRLRLRQGGDRRC
jgi:hypothetical protein